MEGNVANAILQALSSGATIPLPSLLVVAHPDDETLGLGARLGKFENLTIVQLTDGAPTDCRDAYRLGFSDCRAYAAVREEEARRALAILQVHCRRICCDIPDQSSIFRIADLLDAIESELRRAEIVLTHPYEGGHPDHDSAALVVQAACRRLAGRGVCPPQRYEFTSYHCRNREMVTGEFWPATKCTSITVALDDATQRLKERALAAYRTQSQIIRNFRTDLERYRIAPEYDFARPPPPGTALYDIFGWQLTAAEWRRRAAAALHRIFEAENTNIDECGQNQ